MEWEDVWFSRPHYAYALSQYCKANHVTAEQIRSGEGISKARDYAMREAQKATYRDVNGFSQMVSSWGRKGGTLSSKGFGAVMEGILPFRKTPANILARGVEYSPIGLLTSLTWDLHQVRQGKMSGAEAIDHISAGLTGTGLVALGALCAAYSVVRGRGSEDDDEREFEELMGHQAYALEVGGKSYTLDWLAPEALPFFIGVNLWEMTQGRDDGKTVTLDDVMSAVSNVSEPLLEMSCLQSLNDVFDAVGYASNNDTSALSTILYSAATSYLTQALPTLLGQFERSAENVRMSTFTEKNTFLPGDLQYTIGRASARIPGVDYHQIPYIDAWGRTEDTGGLLERVFNNFANPAYASDIEMTEVEKELLRLFEATGESGVFPDRAPKYFTVKGVRRDLSAEEYVVYATEKGERSFAYVGEILRNPSYKRMSEAERVSALKDAYDMANQEAKSIVDKSFDADGWVKEAEIMEKQYKVPRSDYLALKSEVSTITSLKDSAGKTISGSKSLLIMEAAYDLLDQRLVTMSNEGRRKLFEFLGVGKTMRDYQRWRVKQELAEMRKKAR